MISSKNNDNELIVSHCSGFNDSVKFLFKNLCFISNSTFFIELLVFISGKLILNSCLMRLASFFNDAIFFVSLINSFSFK